MKYYLIVGEASGDLHAAHLMKAIRKEDSEAEFRFFGGDNMAAAGGTMVKHYRELAYMGFVPVLLHLPTILRNMRMCKADIMAWQPHAVILVDYAGFNLSIAKYLRSHNFAGKVFYYISPKLWAWKEYRIKNIKRDIDELFSILPFEKDFFEKKHGYPIHYVGNPTADEVRQYLAAHQQSPQEINNPSFRIDNLAIDNLQLLPLSPGTKAFSQKIVNRKIVNKTKTQNPKPKTIAILAGSRRQEIKDNLPAMLQATRGIHGYKPVVAGAPGIERDFYAPFLEGYDASIVHGETYRLLSESTAALVTSGTATLETCMFRVPQVVCYKTPLPRLCRWGFEHILKVKYISLVNLIADREVVRELFADRFSIAEIRRQLIAILPGSPSRDEMLRGYDDVHQRLGGTSAPDNAARLMVSKIKMSLSRNS